MITRLFRTDRVRTGLAGTGLGMMALVLGAAASCDGAERGALHDDQCQCEVLVRDGGAGVAAEIGRHSRYQHARLLRQWHQEARRHDEHG